MNPSLALLTLGLLVASAAAAEERSSMMPGALAHALDRLSNTGRVLYIAAHPDDENTRLLGYLANHRHVTAGYLSMTRGEGGQNLIGSEKGELLGIIRTQELLAARRVDGAVQFFTRMRDFGYSKSPDEALRIWGEDAALADVVWTLRRFQPDVVVTRFNELPPNHGHHTASAILARKAVEAAADPSRFPEQLAAGAKVWKVQRLMHNVSTWRDVPPPDALPLDVGAYDVRLGLSYGELAAHSRSQHKSQGFGSAGERGQVLEHFTFLAGSQPKKDLLEAVDLTWGRYGAAGQAVGKALAEAQAKLHRDRPEQTLPALVQAGRALESLPADARVLDARRELETLMLGATGLFLRATAATPAVTPGNSLPVQVEAVLRRPASVTLRKVHTAEPKAALELNAKKMFPVELLVPASAPVSSPYWLPVIANGGRDAVEDLSRVGRPEEPAPLRVKVELDVGGRAVTLELPVVNVWTDRVHGERERRVLVTPPATVTPAREAVMVPNGRAASVQVRVRAQTPGVSGAVRLPVPSGWSVSPPSVPVSLAKAGDEVTVTFQAEARGRTAAPFTTSPELEAGGKVWSFREDVIDHPHLPMQVVLAPSRVKVVPLALQSPKGLVGYVEGSGDTIVEDLQHAGLKVQPVDDATLRSGELSRFSALVFGIRAFNTRPALSSTWPRLVRYMEGGGTVLVQYNTHNSRFAPLDAQLGPYPLTLGQSRVTDETAAVQPLNASSPLLTRPNRLNASDWDGWVQERGLYFAEKWDARYSPLLRIADPNEAPLEGSVLVAPVGKGRYVYTGLSFFRQLPAGVPGAYRLFANLISPNS